MLLRRCCDTCIRPFSHFATISSLGVKDNISPTKVSFKCNSAYGTSTSHQGHKIWYRKEGAAHFIKNLSIGERRELMTELTKYPITTAAEDPTSANEKSLRLDASQLRYVALLSAVPFVGFGLLDNTFMLIAGEYIDITFGAMLGITTMAAAGLGNMVSDVLGITTAGFVEQQTASRLGLKAPLLSLEQMNSRSYRWISNLGRCVGVVIGCFLGMLPLFVKEKTCSAVGKPD